LPQEAFETIWRLMKVALIRCDISQDYSTAKSLMHMASTYYRNINGVNDYIQSRLRNMELWERPRYWDFALYDAVSVERNKQESTARDWLKMRPHEQTEHLAREHSIFFGQLGSFIILMISFGMDREDVRSFVSKQCVANGIDPEDCTLLLRNVDDAADNIAAHEQSVNQILITLAADSASKEARDTEELSEQNNRQDELERLQKMNRVLKNKENAQKHIVDTSDMMKMVVDKKYSIEEAKIAAEFDHLRSMLEAKEAQIINDTRNKKKETLERLSIDMNFMEQSRKQTQSQISKSKNWSRRKTKKILCSSRGVYTKR